MTNEIRKVHVGRRAVFLRCLCPNVQIPRDVMRLYVEVVAAD